MKYETVNRQTDAHYMLKNVKEGVKIGVVYRGRVLDNVDPSGAGRIKAEIFSLYNNMEVQDIPWALPCFPTASYNSGAFTIPQIGDTVWVLFENNDIFRPVYIGCVYTVSPDMNLQVGSSVAPAYENYVPNEGRRPDHFVVQKTPQGSGLWMNDEDGTAHFYSSSGGELNLGSDNIEMNYREGGSFASSKGRAEMASPLESRVIVTDEGEGGQEVIIKFDSESKTNIRVVKDKKIILQVGDNKKICIDEEEDNVKIYYNDERCATLDSEGIMLDNAGDTITMKEGSISITAKDVINISAPVVNISEG